MEFGYTEVLIQWWQWSYGGVVEGGTKKEMPPGGVVADGQKYARSSYFNLKFGV